jgi:hypothetical protein
MRDVHTPLQGVDGNAADFFSIENDKGQFGKRASDNSASLT